MKEFLKKLTPKQRFALYLGSAIALLVLTIVIDLFQIDIDSLVDTAIRIISAVALVIATVNIKLFPSPYDPPPEVDSPTAEDYT